MTHPAPRTVGSQRKSFHEREQRSHWHPSIASLLVPSFYLSVQTQGLPAQPQVCKAVVSAVHRSTSPSHGYCPAFRYRVVRTGRKPDSIILEISESGMRINRRPIFTLPIRRSRSQRRIAASVTLNRSAACRTVSKLHSELPISLSCSRLFVCANRRVRRRIANTQAEGIWGEISFRRLFFGETLVAYVQCPPICGEGCPCDP
jgi:hypothetical protein